MTSPRGYKRDKPSETKDGVVFAWFHTDFPTRVRVFDHGRGEKQVVIDHTLREFTSDPMTQKEARELAMEWMREHSEGGFLFDDYEFEVQDRDDVTDGVADRVYEHDQNIERVGGNISIDFNRSKEVAPRTRHDVYEDEFLVDGTVEVVFDDGRTIKYPVYGRLTDRGKSPDKRDANGYVAIEEVLEVTGDWS